MASRSVPLVAVLGQASEAPCALLIDALGRLPCRTLVLDQDGPVRPLTRWDVDEQGRLCGEVKTSDATWPLASIAGLYLRPADERRLHLAAQQTLQSRQAWAQTWIEIAEIADFRVVNRVSAMASNGSKPLQSQCLAAVGFAIPPMLMTNLPQAVLDFEATQGALVYKSASGIRSIVSEFDAAAHARLDQVRHTPTLFQKRLQGTNLRVHVIGSEIFATEVDSDGVDYRYAAQQGGMTTLRPTRLPLDLEGLCRAAAEALGLAFAGLDLMLADDGLVYCFEANPSPGYSYFESATGQPIAAALARHLCGRD